MLICNNCNSVNEDGTQRCIHCHMEGDFRRQMDLGENKSDDTPVLQYKIVCRNCGSAEPGEDVNCAHCHFPLARVKATTGLPVTRPDETEQPSVIPSTIKQP